MAFESELIDMPVINIDGVGDVEVDGSFLNLRPDAQQRELASIVGAIKGTNPTPVSSRAQGTATVLEATLKDAFPQARVTGRGRSAARNAAVNGVPNSYHLDNDALDVAPLPGVTVAQVRQAFADRGIPLTEAMLHNAGSGLHLHLAWDGKNGNPTVSPAAQEVGNSPTATAAPGADQGTGAKADAGEGWSIGPDGRLVVDVKGDAPPVPPIVGEPCDPDAPLPPRAGGFADLKPVPKGYSPDTPQVDSMGAALLGMGDAATFGVMDELGAGVDTLTNGKSYGEKALRTANTLSRVNDLEQSYLPYADVAAMDLTPTRKLALRNAMDRARSLPQDQVDALRTDDVGHAVADGITQVQRLRNMVEVPSSAGGARSRASVMGIGADTLATMGAAAIAGPKGAMLARLGSAALTNGADRSTANDVVKLATARAKVLPKLEAMLADQPPAPDNLAALASKAQDARDAKYLAGKASALAKAKEAAQAAEQEAANRRVGVENDRRNIVSGGGWRGTLYDRTGLMPADQDAAALSLLKDGRINPDQFGAFLGNPEKLMPGNAGNAIIDAMNAKADAGEFARNPHWSPAPALADPTTNVTGSLIANVEAYRATAQANQQRVSSAIERVQNHPTLGTDAKATIGAALATLGNTSSRADADALVADTVNGLPKRVQAEALNFLQPIAAQIRK